LLPRGMTAAAARKLQKDIDIALKKVDDGLEEFDGVWEQATGSSNSSQKEKLGEELKKSINKLQRLRVQIREWISQGDTIKSNSKDRLEEARKRIEQNMHRFKEFERDLKTKAFSACALAKEDELEIEEVEKLKYQEWIVSVIQSLNEQLEQFEADQEILQRRQSPSADERSRLEQVRTYQERHQWHIKKLELILRKLDNDDLDTTDLAIVRESVESYVEDHHDPDYYHDEGLYDCFELQELEAKPPEILTTEQAKEGGGTPTPSAGGGAREEPARKGKEKVKKQDKKDKKKEEREKKVGTPNSNKAASPGNTLNAEFRADCKLLPESATSQVEDEVKVQADQLCSGDAEEFVCKICQTHVVGCGPKLTNCSHLFCGDCLGQWFNQHPESQTWAQRARSAGPDRVVPCPVCKQPLHEKRDLYPVDGATSRSENLLLWRMLSSLKIMCVNHVRMGGSCEWTGEYGQYQKHISSCPCQPQAEAATAEPRGAVAVAAAPAPPPRPDPRDAPDERRRGAPPGRASAQPPEPPRGAPAVPTAAPATAPAPTAAPAPAAAAAQGGKPPAVTVQPTAAAVQAAAPAKDTSAVAIAGPFHAPLAEEQERRTAAPTQQPQPRPTRQQPQQAPSPVVQPQPQPQQSPQSRKVAPTTPTVSPQDGDGSFTATATSAFEPGAGAAGVVPIRVGDTIQVLERHASGWTYCKNVSLSTGFASMGLAEPVAGWAPSWVVAQPVQEVQTNPAQAQPVQEVQQPVQTQPQAPQKAEQTSHSRSPQLSVAAAPTPQHQAQTQPLRTATVAALAPAPAPAPAPVAPKAPSSVVRVATAAFCSASPSQLSMMVGDLVEIIERDSSGWTYGRKVSQHVIDVLPAVEGWFPDWVCTQR